MANPINCDMGCGLVAVLLVGNLETGDQTAFCAADFARAGLAAARAQLPAEEVMAFLGLTPEAPETPAMEGDREPGGRKRKARKSAPEAPPVAVAEGLEAAPAAAPDGGA